MTTNKPKIVIARAPKRTRAKKAPVAFIGPRIVTAKKPGRRFYAAPKDIPTDPTATARVKAFFDRMMRPPNHLA